MKLNRSEKFLLAALFIYSFIPAFGGLFRILELAGGPPLGLPENPRALTAPVIIGLHILGSGVFCVAGALQFLPSLRSHHPVAADRQPAAATARPVSRCAPGLWMTHFFSFPAELQGSLLYVVRMILGLSMIGLITWAVLAVRAGNLHQHRASMLRAYAIGQGASTQAFIGIGWMLITGSETQGLLRDGLMVFSWGLNLLVAQWLITRWLRREGSTPSNRASTLPARSLAQY